MRDKNVQYRESSLHKSVKPTIKGLKPTIKRLKSKIKSLKT